MKMINNNLNKRIARIQSRIRYYKVLVSREEIRQLIAKKYDDEKIFQILFKKYVPTTQNENLEKAFERVSQEYDELQVKYVKLNNAYHKALGIIETLKEQIESNKK